MHSDITILSTTAVTESDEIRNTNSENIVLYGHNYILGYL